ncbi:hypothetical protein [Pseudomonas sp. AK106]
MIRGNVDIANEEVLAGWIADTAHLANSVRINIFVNGDFAFSSICDMYRKDIFDAVGSGNHGFEVALAPHLSFGKNIVDVKAEGLAFEFPQSRFVVKCRRLGAEDLVEQGRDGWLFLKNDSNKFNDVLQGHLPLDKEMLKYLRRTFSYRRAFAIQSGCKFLQVIVPDKNVICNSYKTVPLAISEARPSIQLCEELGGGLTNYTFYIADDLMRESDPASFFYKTDTHLSPKGQVFLMDFVLGFFNIAPSYDVELELEEFVGDLGDKLDPPLGEQALKVLSRSEVRVVFDTITPALISGATISGNVLHRLREQPKGYGRLYLYGTSSANQMLSLLCAQFDEVVFTWGNSADPDLVTKFKPHFVLGIFAERFLSGPPQDLNIDTDLSFLDRRSVE